MIIVQLKGGLGNQMFQYAAAFALARAHNTQLVLDTTFLHKSANGYTKREFELAVFSLTAQLPTDAQAALFQSMEQPTIWERFKFKFLSKNKIYAEPHFHFDPHMLQQQDGTYLNGYWQSEKYFLDVESKLRKEFVFKSVPSERNAELLTHIINENSVALHVRRGDYLNKAITAGHHPVCSVEYYDMAIHEVINKVSEPIFYIFSDDVDWAMQNLKLPADTVYVNHNTGAASFEDMRLMSHCKHHIIANSSFSWWGAWLAKHANQIVIAPKNWFANATVDTKDLVPSNWIRL
jgi:Glycosyl transferase family 11